MGTLNILVLFSCGTIVRKMKTSRKHWSSRNNIILGKALTIHEPLISREKLILPLLHIQFEHI